MSKFEGGDISHLEWLVESRARNQGASLKLLSLFEKYPRRLRNRQNAALAEAMVAIGFSLWRGAFLADKSGAKGGAVDDAEAILGRMLLDNAITYPQDRAAREWTFNYYVGNAHYRFQVLTKHAGWTNLLHDKPKNQKPKARWEYYETKFEEAVDLLSDRLSAS